MSSPDRIDRVEITFPNAQAQDRLLKERIEQAKNLLDQGIGFIVVVITPDRSRGMTHFGQREAQALKQTMIALIDKIDRDVERANALIDEMKKEKENGQNDQEG